MMSIVTVDRCLSFFSNQIVEKEAVPITKKKEACGVCYRVVRKLAMRCQLEVFFCAKRTHARTAQDRQVYRDTASLRNVDFSHCRQSIVKEHDIIEARVAMS